MKGAFDVRGAISIDSYLARGFFKKREVVFDEKGLNGGGLGCGGFVDDLGHLGADEEVLDFSFPVVAGPGCEDGEVGIVLFLCVGARVGEDLVDLSEYPGGGVVGSGFQVEASHVVGRQELFFRQLFAEVFRGACGCNVPLGGVFECTDVLGEFRVVGFEGVHAFGPGPLGYDGIGDVEEPLVDLIAGVLLAFEVQALF